MSFSALDGPTITNRLLERLPNQEFKRLRSKLESVRLHAREVLCEQGAEIPFVYFPNQGVVSPIAYSSDGRSVEVGTVGNEGMVGIPVLLNDNIARTKWIVQIPDSAVRMKADVLRELTDRNPVFRNHLLRFVSAFLSQITQSVLCNRLHSAKERCCRWLLMTHDRVSKDRFPLTQEFLAQMLGVRRAGVNAIVRDLQQNGLIESGYGSITIVDRALLESESCECYAAVRREFDRLLA